jgi:Na+-driven multidrug efflux pump
MTHYLVGGSLALTYPAVYFVSAAPLPGSHVLPSLVWGLATTLLPWLIFYPAFGWGLFGVGAPQGTRPVLSPTVSHLVYGLGVGSVLSIASQLWSV